MREGDYFLISIHIQDKNMIKYRILMIRGSMKTNSEKLKSFFDSGSLQETCEYHPQNNTWNAGTGHLFVGLCISMLKKTKCLELRSAL